MNCKEKKEGGRETKEIQKKAYLDTVRYNVKSFSEYGSHKIRRDMPNIC